MKLPSSTPAWLRRLLSSPGGGLTRWERAARYAIDLAWHCAKALQHDRAEEMAAALTYRTIFSLIPIVVLSLVVFSISTDFDKHRPAIQAKALKYFGFDVIAYGDVEQVPEGETAAPEASERTGSGKEKPKVVIDQEPGGEARAIIADPGDEPTAPETVPPDAAEGGERPAVPARTTAQQKEKDANVVLDNINKAIDKLQNMPYKSIGIVGLVLLIWGALGLVIALEDSFNRVFGASVGRSYTRRIVIYWFALTVGPILLALSTYLAGRFLGFVEEYRWDWLTTLIEFGRRFTAVFVSWALLVFLYRLMPNAQVQLRPAAIGALVAAILWEIGKAGFALYVRTALPYNALYGSLGLIPLFLFWVYITWLIILFGLELTYTLQNMRGRTFKHEAHKQTDDQLIDTAWLVPLAAGVAQAFSQGRAAKLDELSRAMNLPPRAVTKMLGALEDANVIRHVVRGEEKEGVSLARPAEQIPVAQVLEAGRRLLPDRDPTRNGHAAWRFVEQLHDNRPLLEGTTLADLVEAEGPPQKREGATKGEVPRQATSA